MQKRAILCQIKESKPKRGGVVLYAAQAQAQLDAELAQKGRFSQKINQSPTTTNQPSRIFSDAKTSNFASDQGKQA